MVCGRFNSYHIRCIRQVVALHGFTGEASIGVALEPMGGGTEGTSEQDVGYGMDDTVDSQELPELQEEQED